MPRTLFPSIPSGVSASPAARLPVPREVKWDFALGRGVFRDGEPVYVDGSEAVAVWAYHAIQAQRYRYEHESWQYGNELFKLRGLGYQQATMEAEIRRYLAEALLASPYISAAETVEVRLTGDDLHATVRYQDIYGGGDTIHV